MEAKKSGYPICLYLDAATHTRVEEFSTSNFIGIDNTNKRFITPKSPSVLPSVTNKSLQTIAKDYGMTIEARDISEYWLILLQPIKILIIPTHTFCILFFDAVVDELESFDEVVACGTAVVVTPIGSLTRLNSDGGGGGKPKTYQFTTDVGETTRILYDRVRSIQNGEAEDVHKWNFKVQ
jgi:branched-chain amino acid aminotransferase